jgi:hypothetical protein
MLDMPYCQSNFYSVNFNFQTETLPDAYEISA